MLMADSGRLDELQRRFDENPRRYFAPLANEYRKTGEIDRAIELCRAHLPHQPGHMSGYIVYGQALYDAHRSEEAAAVFQEALRIDPENIIALRHLGDIARVNGDLGSAAIWYDRVLSVDPKNDEVAAYLASMTAARDAQAAPQPEPVDYAHPVSEYAGATGAAHTEPDYSDASYRESSVTAEHPAESASSEPSSDESLGTAYPEEMVSPPGLAFDPFGEPFGAELDATTPMDASAHESMQATPAGSSAPVGEYDPLAFGTGFGEMDPLASAEDDAASPAAGLQGLSASEREAFDLREPSIEYADEAEELTASSYGMPASMDPAMRNAAQSLYRAVPDDPEAPSAVSSPALGSAPPADAASDATGDVSLAAGVEPHDSPAPEAASIEAAAMSEPTVALAYDEDEGAVSGEPNVSSPFVTETMAELYLQQGFLGEALTVYRQLAAQRDEPRLQDKVRELEARVRDAMGDEFEDDMVASPDAESIPMITDYAMTVESTLTDTVVTSPFAVPLADGAPLPSVAEASPARSGARGERVRDFFARLGARQPEGPSSVRMAQVTLEHDPFRASESSGLAQLFGTSAVNHADAQAAALLAHAYAPVARHDSVTLPQIQ
jgi:tetratricopeptide (TPR) repeat protein